MRRPYTPQLHPENITRLYHVSKKCGLPMTKVMNRIVSAALKELENTTDPSAFLIAEPARPGELFATDTPDGERHDASTGGKAGAPAQTTNEKASRLQTKRWLRALGIAKILFEEEGYHTAYLEEIEQCITTNPLLPQVAGGKGNYRSTRKVKRKSK